MATQDEWNLTELYQDINCTKIQQAITQAYQEAEVFEQKYRGKIRTLPPEGLLKCLQDMEEYNKRNEDICLYASLTFAADMTSQPTQALHDRVEKMDTKIGKQLAFYSLELGSLIKTNPELIDNPALANYRHLLQRVQRRVKHQLSEVEEQLIIEKDQFGVNAWEELQSKWLNTRLFEVTVLGKKKTLSYSEANGLLPHPDRATRESANRSIYGLLGKDGEVFASSLRNICNDWVSVSKRRKYVTPMEASLLNNDTQQDIINNLLSTIEKGSAIYRRYLKLKAKLMELPILGNHDIIAPLSDSPNQKFDYQQAEEIITKAYSHFSPEYAEAVKEMFQKHRIDIKPRFGKRNGAFCASHYKAKSAYILQSFNGTLSDVFTLAHELGHATHDWYMSRHQTMFNTSVPSTVAETASIFGELLLTDLILDGAESDTEQKGLLCLVLDEAGMTTFQVTARVWFEQSLYESIEKGEFLDYLTICNHWINSRDRIYGDSVTWFPEMDSEWAMKPHYFMANYRFYNYPYVYAQMFVYSLYEQYLREGEAFVPKFVSLLAAGSSKSPLELAADIGLDLTAPDFWKGGVKMFEHFVTDLEKCSK
jgi:oligoendopeptidase F